jgi:peptide chain release factor 2
MSARDVQAAVRRGSAPRTSIGFGHAVRSYVLDPYQQVKDLRTGVVRTDAKVVLDGDIDGFIGAALVWNATKPPEDDSIAKLD